MNVLANAIDYDYFKEELIDGKVHLMSPSASPIHGRIIGNVYFVFKSYLKGKTCQVFTDTIDVYLDEHNNKVIPDVSILCDESKFSKRGYEGVPDLIVEIISPSSVIRDRKVKFQLYEKFGVKEYWIIDPINKVIEQYVLNDGKYKLEEIYAQLDECELDRLSESDKNNIKTTFKTSIFKELVINVSDIFE